MPPFDEAAYQAGLAQLRARFCNGLDTRLSDIGQSWAQPLPRSDSAALLHKLAGAAGSLGFTELQSCARTLERAAAESMETADAITRQLRAAYTRDAATGRSD